MRRLPAEIQKQETSPKPERTEEGFTCDFPGCSHIFSSEQDKDNHWHATHADANDPNLRDECKRLYEEAANKTVKDCPDIKQVDIIKKFH